MLVLLFFSILSRTLPFFPGGKESAGDDLYLDAPGQRSTTRMWLHHRLPLFSPLEGGRDNIPAIFIRTLFYPLDSMAGRSRSGELGIFNAVLTPESFLFRFSAIYIDENEYSTRIFYCRGFLLYVLMLIFKVQPFYLHFMYAFLADL